jgi:hypothetical protein
MKILIDPADDIQYKSFYIYALIHRFGSENVMFLDAPFRDLSVTERNTKSMRFIIVDGTKERRYAIHCDDKYTIHDELYRWADVYGCVNTNWAKTPEKYHSKLISLCPSFAIRYTTPLNAIQKAIITLPCCHINPKKHLGRWKRMLQRPTYEDYSHLSPLTSHLSPFLFHLSTLWQSDEWNRNDETVNQYRATFIRVCKSIPGLHFEGGLVSHRHDDDARQFDDCLTHPCSSTDYLNFTKQSIFVFNTPAYWGCHGWKLGEYMSLGKAMLSTPLGNDLPTPLRHGEHYHLVDNTDEKSIHEAVVYLLEHPDYCLYLGKKLHQYWNTYGSPEATLKLLGI